MLSAVEVRGVYRKRFCGTHTVYTKGEEFIPVLQYSQAERQYRKMRREQKVVDFVGPPRPFAFDVDNELPEETPPEGFTHLKTGHMVVPITKGRSEFRMMQLGLTDDLSRRRKPRKEPPAAANQWDHVLSLLVG